MHSHMPKGSVRGCAPRHGRFCLRASAGKRWQRKRYVWGRPAPEPGLEQAQGRAAPTLAAVAFVYTPGRKASFSQPF